MEVIKLNHIYKTFYNEQGSLNVIEDFNLIGNSGEIIGIVGPSGSGKSTILNIISGLLKVTKGEVLLKGKVGYMFQKDLLMEWRNIYNNLLIGLELNKTKSPYAINKMVNLVEKYGLKEFLYSYPKELSGGMRQRISLIRTLCVEPDILLLDEPFSALDYQTRLSVCEDVYKIIKDQNTCSILVTHDIGEALSMCDKVIVLSNRPAKVKKIYDVKDIFKDINSPIKRRSHPLFSQYFNEIWQEMRGNQ
ncbi:MAG: ABC transporter ATP-binding protein [Bacilli bacterium]|nr:ABC transporter ATP-binding protein [Bacilli bacterium]